MKNRFYAIIACIILITLTGCNQVLTEDQKNLSSATESVIEAIPRPEVPTETATPEPAAADEAQKSDPVEAFEKKLSGVWGNLVGGCYFESYEGSEISSGWFESDALPKAHIKEVEEISEDKYTVVIEVDPEYDEEGNEYESYTYEATYDGSFDGFKTSFISSNEDNDYLYIRLGDNMDEAWNYYSGSFADDYKKLAEGYKGKLRESPVGRWYTEDYDTTNNWAGSYYLEFNVDGTASCVGWRNKDTGTYEITAPGKLKITFDHCEYDNPEVGGWDFVKGFVYTIDMEYYGNESTIKINAPDVISNLTNGPMQRK